MAASGLLPVLFLVLRPVIVSAQGPRSTAVVTGADRVHIRRGPGLDHPPVATLPRGTTVEVQAMQGEWARVVTPHGQIGYVNSTFLALPGEKPVAPPAAVPQAVPATPMAAEPAAVRSLREENAALAAQLRSVQDELNTLKSGPELTAGAASPPTPQLVTAIPDAEQLHKEIGRLSAAIDGLNRRLDANPASDAMPITDVPTEMPHVVSTATLVLAGIGIFFGWVMGSAYGRRQERGRRSRVRF
jgi:hypothetical protein